MNHKVISFLLIVVIGLIVWLGFFSKQSRGIFSGNGEGMALLLKNQKSIDKRLAKIESFFEGLIKGSPQGRGKAPAQDKKKYDIPIEHSILIGKKMAPVTIVEFVDFQCPYCSKFHGAIEEVLKAYPKKVNYVLKNFPLSFHPQAAAASKAAFAAAEQGKYGEMVVALLSNGRKLTQDVFEKLALDMGLDVEKFKKDLQDNDAQYQAYIQKDMDLGAKVGVRGTPTFFINGVKTNARDFISYKKEIDKILKNKK